MEPTFLDYDDCDEPIIVENIDYQEFEDSWRNLLEIEAAEAKIVEVIETQRFVETIKTR